VTPNGVESRVIGVTSHAYDDSICLKGGIDTRVDAWLDWVDSKMRAGCESKTRSWCEIEGIILPDYATEPNTISAKISGLMERFLAYLLSWLS
jgi:hypothetical protein